MPLTLSGSNGVSGIDGTVSTPSERGSDADTGIYYPSAGTMALATNGTQAVYVDASQNVGIGTSSTSSKFHVYGAGVSNLGKFEGTTGSPYVTFVGSSGTTIIGNESNGGWVGTTGSQALVIKTNDTERMRIDSSGNLLVGKSVTTFSTAGTMIAAAGYIDVSTSGDRSINVNRTTNDGNLINFYQDGTLEGNIAVSGTTVSYNGGHLARWSQLLNGERDPSILKGTVMSNLDEMCLWEKDGVSEANEQLNRMKISDIEGDINVAGVFVNWDNDDTENPYDMNIAMTGDMIIRIADDIVVQKGDLLISAGDGTAKPQADDIIRSNTIAKVTSNHVTCTYDDGSYCVPCVLMAC